ncbi:CaiB/BaiF CoA-transferase family protein [uncultured Oscillibacter sp.]|uniref:CaiB/BaiF CoA transferase family protein n=1 Tax=uncultured Oscillibacter sp. TaxID=876091 RepID=UPI0025F08109|nr:CaiB/BaiF CoA-transferase family protein [uncultured Oscillibacter sp.]
MIEGVKVLSFTHYLQGPSCAQILADLGADVVKVEALKGAYERNWSGCDAYLNGVSVFFLQGNRNQGSLSINLKSEEARKIIYDLVKTTDVVVENFRPGVMNKLGYSYEALSAINPKLIYCSCSGYGPDGPYLKRPGQDLLAQSISGLASLNGAGEPYNIGCTLVDQHGATLAALGVLAALLDRDRTGKGHLVDASLLNAALDIQMEPLGLYLNGGKLSERASTGLSTRYHEPPYGSYKTKDGYLTVSLTSFENLHKIFDPEEVDQFTRDDQLHDRVRFDRMIAQQMLQKTTAEWTALFEEEGIWYAPVNEYEDMLKDPQVNHIQPFLEMDHPVAGHVKVLAHPLRYDGKTLPLRKLPPELGESTRELLTGLGYTEEQIQDLVAQGIVKTNEP